MNVVSLFGLCGLSTDFKLWQRAKVCAPRADPCVASLVVKVFRSVVWSGLRVALREFSAWHSDYGVCFVVRSSESSFRVLGLDLFVVLAPIALGTSLKLLRRTQCAFD